MKLNWTLHWRATSQRYTEETHKGKITTTEGMKEERDLALGLFNCLYFTQFLKDFGQILDSESYDQAQQTL